MRAAIDIGLRACVTRSTRDISDPIRPTPDDMTPSAAACVALTDRLFADWHGARQWPHPDLVWAADVPSTCPMSFAGWSNSGRTRPAWAFTCTWPSPPSENAEVMKRFGFRPVERFRQLGLLDRNLFAVHMGAVNEAEVDVVAANRVSVGHCASASMFGAFGCIAHGKIPELAQAGVTMAIGTDAASISRFLDLIREMYVVATAHKDVKLDAEVMGAHKAFEMATIDGAKALMWDDEIGSLEVGKRADVVLIGMDGLEWYPRPMHNPVANLVYSSAGHAVQTVIIDGKIVMRDRKLLTIDEAALKLRTQGEAVAAAQAAGIHEDLRWTIE